MRIRKYLLIAVGFLPFIASITSCTKTSTKDACYDERLYQQSKNLFCSQDCPGVTGCDGKTYCNACEAATQGIRVR